MTVESSPAVDLSTVETDTTAIESAINTIPNLSSMPAYHERITINDTLDVDRFSRGGEGFIFLQSFVASTVSLAPIIQLYDGDSSSGDLIAKARIPAGESEVIGCYPLFFKNGFTVKASGGGAADVEILASVISVTPSGNASEIAIADTKIRQENATTNYGNDITVGVRNQTGNHEKALVKFGLGSLTAGSSVTSAILRLTAGQNITAQTVKVYRLNAEWLETEATWNERKTGVNWNAAGLTADVDYEATEYAATAVTCLSGETYSLDITDLVNEWLAGTYPNYGVLIWIPTVDGGANGSFKARTDSGKEPTLVCTY